MYFYEFLLYLIQSELVGVVEMSELRTWYEKVMKDNAASAYVLHPLGLPLSQFTRGRIRRLKAVKRLKLVEKSKSIFELLKYMKYYSLYTRGCGGVWGFQNSGCQ